MKKFIAVLFLIIPLAGHSQKHKRDSPVDSASFMNAHTGGGTSVADAVIINEKKSETKVITEKNNWLRFKYPGYTYIKSIIIQNTSTKSISMTEIKKADGEIIDVYFDDTAFYSPYVKTPAK